MYLSHDIEVEGTTYKSRERIISRGNNLQIEGTT